eukprot:154067-Amphidinium_carterae.1
MAPREERLPACSRDHPVQALSGAGLIESLIAKLLVSPLTCQNNRFPIAGTKAELPTTTGSADHVMSRPWGCILCSGGTTSRCHCKLLAKARFSGGGCPSSCANNFQQAV